MQNEEKKNISIKLENNVVLENIVLSNTNSISYAKYKELLDNAEALDGEDQFDHLYISTSSYASNKYINTLGIEQTIGIKYDNVIHRDKRRPIYPHQEKAAQRFLKNFRGVGVLADEVGMGKTIEAGIIMSELAERKLISSVLIVAASLDNLKNWINELGEKFGLFPIDEEGNYNAIIVNNLADIYRSFNDGKPMGPLLINMSDFTKLSSEGLNDIIFDLIIFDEAHNLDNSDDGKDGMKVLNKLMANKKRAGKPYCILLSGTPHKGNLDSMFPLWYFMKKDAFQTREDAQRHYKNYLCHGASTMAEFIQFYKAKHLNKNESYLKFKEQEILKRSRGEDAQRISNYLQNNDYSIMQLFLKTEEGKKALIEIKRDARKNYYSLIDSFMIRQPRKNCNAGGRKIAHNYYFLPLYGNASFDNISIKWGGNDFYTSSEKELILQNHDFNSDEAIKVDGKYYSIDSYLKVFLLPKFQNDSRFLYGEKNRIILQFFEEANAYQSGTFDENDVFNNKYRIDSDYYQKTFMVSNDDVYNDFVIVKEHTIESIMIARALKFVEIANEKANDQIIVFFDEEQERAFDERIYLRAYLKENYPDLASRVIMDAGEGAQAISFEKKKNGILFASKKLAESSNFQFCHTIINFSISKSPIIMDQKIGRIDRIGQVNDMDIYTFARMDKIDGYIATLFNEIDLFSGWKNDIILVTGCDNKNAKIKICDNCQAIIRDVNDSMSQCPNCGGVLNRLMVTDNYRCTNDKCSFVLTRKLTFSNEKQDFSQGASYQCPKGVKLVLCTNMDGEETYTCPKSCLIKNCRRKQNPCLIADSLENMNLNKMNFICSTTCERKKCDACDITINAYGKDIETGEVRTNNPCYLCVSRPKCFYEFNLSRPKCQYCGSDMEAIVPSTFDEFAKYLWDNSQFVEDYKNESYKIKEIVDILGDRDESEG